VAFLDVNKKKFDFLLSNGSHEDELRRFFIDTRAQLILRGARMQNLPRSNYDRIRAICEQLPKKTDDTVRDWFGKHITLSDPMPSEDVSAYLELYFDQQEDIPVPDRSLIARSGLIYLFNETPDQEILAFLQKTIHNPLPSADADLTDEIIEHLDITEPTTALENVETSYTGHAQLSDLLSAIVMNSESAIDKALTSFPHKTRLLVEGLLYANGGDFNSANNHLAALDTESVEADHIKMAIARHSKVSDGTAKITGIKLRTPQILSELPDSESYDIIGILTNESEAGAIFARPLVLKIEDKIYLLNREHRLALFPESGDVMTHRSEIRFTSKRRDLLYWRVSEKESSNGRTRFRLESELGPVLEVQSIPVPSHDPDEIRERIKSVASTGQLSSTQQTAFVLSDDIILLSPKMVDISRDDAYEMPWQALEGMETWLIEGRQYCLDISKNSSFSIDLSTPESYLRRALKLLESEQKASLSKAQRRDLLELFRSSLNSDGGPRADRIISSLESASLGEEDLEKVLSILNTRKEVQARAEKMFDEVYAELKIQLSSIQTELESLKSRKLQLIKEEKEIESRNKKSVDTTKSLVEQAFLNSVQNGVATLANVEIFKALSGNTISTPAVTSPSSIPLFNLIDTRIVEGPLTTSDALSRLMLLGLNRRQAITLFEVSSLAFTSGILLILRGDHSRQYTKVLARINSTRTGIIEAPMGMTSGKNFCDALSSMRDTTGILILSADLSPLEIYAARLIDSYYESALSDSAIPKPLILSCLGGEMSLPLPENLRQVSIIIELKNPWDEGSQQISDVELDSMSLLNPLRDRILANLEKLNPDYRERVERALVSSITHPLDTNPVQY
jgi:hypothetical protein